MSEAKDTFEARVSRLSNYITRAYKYDKPSLLFAMYMSEFIRADVEKSLEKSLKEQGLKIVNIDLEKNKDIPSYISSMNSHNTVFFLQNMEKGFPDALQFLNFKREELIEHHAKVVFWVKEEELARISTEAPDFFAFRNRVIEFMEVPMAEEHRPALVEFALETEYKSLDEIKRSIELKEKLLSELSGEDEISGYLFGSLGILYEQIGYYKKQIEYAEKALKIAEKIGDRQGEGASFINLGVAYRALGDAKKAIECHGKGLEIAKDIEDRITEGTALTNLGNAYRDLKDTRKAIEYYEKALKIAQEIKDRRIEASVLGSLGITYRVIGDVRKATEYYENALKIAREIGDRRKEGTWLGAIGNSYSDLSDNKKALEYYKKALKIAREIGDGRNEGIWLYNLGINFRHDKKYRESLACYMLAKDLQTQKEDPKLKITESDIGSLKEQLGEKEFEKLEAEVVPRAADIVRRILERTSV
jgi:tetratricopeptide (TPR) repeat protein